MNSLTSASTSVSRVPTPTPRTPTPASRASTPAPCTPTPAPLCLPTSVLRVPTPELMKRPKEVNVSSLGQIPPEGETVSSFAQIPPEIFWQIIGKLPLEQIAHCREVSKEWKKCINSGFKELATLDRKWKALNCTWNVPLSPFTQMIFSQDEKIKQTVPFGSGAAVQGNKRTCYLLPNAYLGEGLIYSLSRTSFVFEEDHQLTLFVSECDDSKKIAKGAWSISGNKLLNTVDQVATVYNRTGKALFTYSAVKQANLNENQLLIETLERRVIHIDLSILEESSIGENLGRVFQTARGNVVFEKEDAIFFNKRQIAALEGRERLLWADDQGALYGTADVIKEIGYKPADSHEIKSPEMWRRNRTEDLKRAGVKRLGPDNFIFYTHNRDKTIVIDSSGKTRLLHGRISPEVQDGFTYLVTGQELRVSYFDLSFKPIVLGSSAVSKCGEWLATATDTTLTFRSLK